MKKLSSKKITELIKAAKRGDKNAFSLFYEYHLSPIFRFIYFRVKNYHEAEDLTQTVFLKAWSNLFKYQEGENPFLSWLYAIARNTVTDYWRKRKETNISDEILSLFPDGKNLGKGAEEGEDFKNIINSLASITEDQQEIIILRFVEGFSHREIADIMNKKEDAVRQLQARAIKSLKSILEKKDYE